MKGADFTSALFLGLRHPSQALEPWQEFTKGVPADLSQKNPEESKALRNLCDLVGCQSGVLGTSTLHLFWDLAGILAQGGGDFLLDSNLYPVGRWGCERATLTGAMVQEFRHYDTYDLAHRLNKRRTENTTPIIISDGFCTGCGRPAPLAEMAYLAAKHGGLLLIDDTQALGVLGHRRTGGIPFGHGGGGSLAFHGLQYAPHVLVIASLAKGLGAPLAFLGANNNLIKLFKANSKTRMSCSPPSQANIIALLHALAINKNKGDILRTKLLQRLAWLRRELKKQNITTSNSSWFPVQSILPATKQATSLARDLRRFGIRTIAHENSCLGVKQLSFIIRADHSWKQLHHLVNYLTPLVKGPPANYLF